MFFLDSVELRHAKAKIEKLEQKLEREQELSSLNMSLAWDNARKTEEELLDKLYALEEQVKQQYTKGYNEGYRDGFNSGKNNFVSAD